MLKRLLPLILLLLSTGAAAETRNPDAHFFDQTFGDLQAELANARKEGKAGVLVAFEMDGCPYCRAMREKVLSQSEVQDYYRKHFAIFAFDIKGDTALVSFAGKPTIEKHFAAEFQVKYTPTFQFFDLDGKATAHFTGVAKGGVREFLALGHYVVEGAYNHGTFADYRKKRQASAP
jgi:thioredoxin-related protein